MAKKKKTHYKCGHCGETGHNARTCPSKTSSKEKKKRPEQPTAQTEEMTVKEQEPPPEPTEESKKKAVEPVPIDRSTDLLDTDRTRPPRPSGPGCHQCPSCDRVAILVLVKIPQDAGGGKEMRCEMCHNKTKISEILIWGAQPGDDKQE